MNIALDKYRVDDLILDVSRIRLIFLLESPYTDEIAHGHPLAGSSGVNMARFLVDKTEAFYDWGRKTPIGCQILSRNASEIGLMNCSNFPLDKTIYCQSDYKRHQEMIDAWDLIRKNPGGVRRNNPAYGAIESEMIEDLARRINKVLPNALIIPCGNVARCLCQKCFSSDKRIYDNKVPHPSRNNWSSEKFFDDIQEFIKEIDRRLSATH